MAELMYQNDKMIAQTRYDKTGKFVYKESWV